MRILMIKTSALGDIIHAFPVLSYIKQFYPQAKIDWVVEKPLAELVRAHPLVDRVLCVQTKKWRSSSLKKMTWQEIKWFYQQLCQYSYDVVLDLQGNIKSGVLTALAKSRLKVGFGYSTVSEWPNMLATHKRYNPPQGENIREDYLFLAQSTFDNFSPIINPKVEFKLTVEEKGQLQMILEKLQHMHGLKALICPGANWSNKQLSQKTWENFLNCFSEQWNVHFLLIWGNQAEKDLVDKLSAKISQSVVIHKLSLATLQNLMTHVDLIIAMDSLPLHLAGTTATPTYSVFGASSAHKYKPVGVSHQAFQGSCPYGKNFDKRCSLLRTCQTGACMKDLEGHRLFNHFFEWWTSYSRLNLKFPIKE